MKRLFSCTGCLAFALLTFAADASVDVYRKKFVHHPVSSGTSSKAYPNPFSYETTIFYQADFDGFVRMNLYSTQGKFLGQLFNGLVERGNRYQVDLNADRLNAGIYYYTIESDNSVIQERLEIVR
jgi:hypothetical protein